MCTSGALEVEWGLNHVDHRVTGIATVDAIRDADNPWLFRDEIGDLEAWSNKWLLVTGTEPTHVIILSEEAGENGIASLAAHAGYLEALPDHPHPRVHVGRVARGGGEAAGLPFALGMRALPRRRRVP